LDWRKKVELYEQIRREYELGVGTIQGVAQKLGVHRRMVRDAVANALPARRKKPQRPRTKLGPATGFIDAILVTDRKEPRKQRHTAHRIWQRVREELNVDVAERTVRQYVEQRKRELGVETAEVFVPQSYGWGQEAQVDWYEAWVELGGERVKLQVFAMRAMASGAAFHRAYRRATQQAFLEAHEEAFAYFGGVFRRLRYDNLAAAVKRVLRGSRREETARFIAFRSHWRFEAEFCTPARGNEKGGVEGEVGRFRRNHLVPVPRAESLDELNAKLLDGCRQDEQRTVAGQTQRVGERLEIERERLLGLAAEGFEIEELTFPTVDGSACVKVRTNFYSTPLRPGTKTQAKIFAETVEVWQDGRCVARHERSYSRQQKVLDLEHYLEALERKPGALAGSTALEQWRRQGRWPESYDRLWGELMRRHGKQRGTQQMLGLLEEGKRQGWTKLRRAIEQALECGCADPAAVRYLLGVERLERVEPPKLILDLPCAERALPTMTAYDQLLGREALR
jgi:transposase